MKTVIRTILACALLALGATACKPGGGGVPPATYHECTDQVLDFGAGAGSVFAHAVAVCNVPPRVHRMSLTIFWAPDRTQLAEDPHEVGSDLSFRIPRPGREVSVSAHTNGFCGLGFYYVLVHVTGVTGGTNRIPFSSTINSRTHKPPLLLHIRHKSDCI